jgi:hypothetical protein
MSNKNSFWAVRGHLYASGYWSDSSPNHFCECHPLTTTHHFPPTESILKILWPRWKNQSENWQPAENCRLLHTKYMKHGQAAGTSLIFKGFFIFLLIFMFTVCSCSCIHNILEQHVYEKNVFMQPGHGAWITVWTCSVKTWTWSPEMQKGRSEWIYGHGAWPWKHGHAALACRMGI